METKRKQMIPRKFVYDAVKANHISPSTYAYIHTRQAKAKKIHSLATDKTSTIQASPAKLPTRDILSQAASNYPVTPYP